MPVVSAPRLMLWPPKSRAPNPAVGRVGLDDRGDRPGRDGQGAEAG